MEQLYHLTKTEQLTPSIVEHYFDWANRFEGSLIERARVLDNLKGATVCSLFFEESTRTRFSFEAAAHQLGANVIGTENAAQFSAAAPNKNESLENTIRVISNPRSPHLRYADIIVLRHPEVGAAQRAAEVSGVPIINAGDGSGEHPTQALLDAYTFKKLLGRLNHFTIAFVGDLRFSRVISSNAILLSHYPEIKMVFVAPKGLKIKNELKSYLNQKEIEFEETNDIKEVVSECDIAYVVRVQKNRIKDKRLLSAYQKNKDNFAITKEVYQMSEEKGTFFCHPMPVDKIEQEIRKEVEDWPRVKIIEQAGNGVPIRMAILQTAWRAQRKKDLAR